MICVGKRKRCGKVQEKKLLHTSAWLKSSNFPNFPCAAILSLCSLTQVKGTFLNVLRGTESMGLHVER